MKTIVLLPKGMFHVDFYSQGITHSVPVGEVLVSKLHDTIAYIDSQGKGWIGSVDELQPCEVRDETTPQHDTTPRDQWQP